MTTMSALLLDRPEPPGTALPGDDDARRHIWCCVPEVALCGADLSGAEDDDGEDERVCALCAIADAEGMACPVTGCKGVDGD